MLSLRDWSRLTSILSVGAQVVLAVAIVAVAFTAEAHGGGGSRSSLASLAGALNRIRTDEDAFAKEIAETCFDTDAGTAVEDDIRDGIRATLGVFAPWLREDRERPSAIDDAVSKLRRLAPIDRTADGTPLVAEVSAPLTLEWIRTNPAGRIDAGSVDLPTGVKLELATVEVLDGEDGWRLELVRSTATLRERIDRGLDGLRDPPATLVECFERLDRGGRPELVIAMTCRWGTDRRPLNETSSTAVRLTALARRDLLAEADLERVAAEVDNARGQGIDLSAARILADASASRALSADESWTCGVCWAAIGAVAILAAALLLGCRSMGRYSDRLPADFRQPSCRGRTLAVLMALLLGVVLVRGDASGVSGTSRAILALVVPGSLLLVCAAKRRLDNVYRRMR
jgi:hypothetical protein